MTAPAGTLNSGPLYTETHLPTKCPICGTFYEVAAEYAMEECGGEGGCPARDAGARPTENHVLCACNRRWVPDDGESHAGHGFDDCTG